MEPTTDLITIARDLRAKVLAGQELTKEEAMLACQYIRQGRRAAAEAAGKTKSKASSGVAPRPAADLMAAFGLGKPK